MTSGQRASQSKFEDWLLYYPWNLLQGLFLCSSNVRDLIELTLFLEDNKARLTTVEVSEPRKFVRSLVSIPQIFETFYVTRSGRVDPILNQ